MTHGNTQAHQTTRRLRLTACAAALAMALTVARLHPVLAGEIVPPPVPNTLEVPAGNQVFLEGHAVGTQNYSCLPTDASVAWTFFGPQATLFDDEDRQLITHFLSPNPDEHGTARATWQDSRDTSSVWAMAIASASDPDVVETGAIPWLLLQRVGAEPGPTGGDRLTRTTFIQRLNTAGGVAPSAGCARSTDVGQRALVPYTADYFFYKAADSE
jgi:Protein of unknown function (DUF3455)